MTKKPHNVPSVIRTFSRAFANYKPPEALTVSQWAEKYRVLSRESSAEAGRWRNERTPYMVEIMDAFTDPKVEKISVVASSQVGKTEIQLNIAAFIIDQDPSSILYIQPSIEEAKKFSRLRIAPMIRDCKKISGKVTEAKARENGNTVLQKSFPGGMLTIIGSNSASALASTPVKYVLGDERDRWALSAGNEGDPWRLAEARTTTFSIIKWWTYPRRPSKAPLPLKLLFSKEHRKLGSRLVPVVMSFMKLILTTSIFSLTP